MPNSSVFIFLMLRALYRMIYQNEKSFFSKNSLSVPNVKLFSIFFFNVFGFSMPFWWECQLALYILSAFPGIKNLNGLNDLDSLNSSKYLLILMVWSFLAPNWPIPVPFCGMDHQKSNFLLISDTFSVRGCWGQPMSFFLKTGEVGKI